MELKVATSCLAAVVSYLDLVSDSTTAGRFKLRLFPVGAFLRLDKAAVRALNLFPAATDSTRV
jgi:DNA mismatch repair protein MSH2